MKLELKRKLEIALSSYLPHKVKMCQRIMRWVGMEEKEVTYGEGQIFSYIGSNTPYVVWDSGRGGISETFLSDFTPESGYKLIIRPLSDLTKEILKDYYTQLMDGDLESVIKDTLKYPLNQSYTFTQYLLKNHYDIFGLIESGLAISYNDIKTKE